MIFKLEDYLNLKQLVPIATLTNRGAWWGDDQLGSTLWILEQKGKVDQGTLALASAAILNSLEGMKQEGLIASATCSSLAMDKQGVKYELTITRPNGETDDFRF